MIDIQGIVDKDHSGNVILNEINLNITAKRVAVIGNNGSGKSRLLKIIGTINKPYAGDISYGFSDCILTLKQYKKLRKYMGYVFQNPDTQIIMPTVKDDLCYGLKHRYKNKQECEDVALSYLEQNQLAHLWQKLSHHLSGGEKQLIALAGVMMQNPELLILDEPTTLLDLRFCNKFMNNVNKFSGHIIMVTHDLDLITDFDHVIWIKQGKVFAQGKPTEIITGYKEDSLR